MTTGSTAPYLRKRIQELVVTRERMRGWARTFSGDMAVALGQLERRLAGPPALGVDAAVDAVQGLARQKGAGVEELVATVAAVIDRVVTDLTAALHDELGTPQLYADPGVWRRAEPKLAAWPEAKKTDHLSNERLVAVYADHAEVPRWHGDQLGVTMNAAGPRGDEALGAALAAVVDHDLNIVRSWVHLLDVADHGPTIFVTFPLDEPIAVKPTLPIVTRTEAAWDADAQGYTQTSWTEPAGLHGTDGGTGIGFIAKAYAARRDLDDPTSGPLDHRIAVAMSTLTGSSSRWDSVDSFAPEELAVRLTMPLQVATTHRITTDHPGSDIAYAVGLATDREQAYLVRADFDGVVTVRHPFTPWQVELSVPEFAACFSALIGGSPPVGLPPPGPDLQGLGLL